MKCLYSIIVTILISNFALAQTNLYVDNNSFVYARDVVLFVNDDIRLETPTSNIYLRGDAQLLQNTDLKNSDAGELSVYQNQTKGIYEYNYWSSPVGVSTDGTVRANVPFNGSNIHDPIDHTDLTNVNSNVYAYTSSPNGTATELSNYWMFTLESGGGYNGWFKIFDTGNASPGYGFTLKGSPNTNNVLDFRGRPNNGDITFNCLFNGTDADPSSGLDHQVNTLTGNPYPSALDLKLIFANVPNNAARLDGNVYFWEQKTVNSHYLQAYEGGYAVYAPGNLGDLNDNGTYARATFGNFDGNGGDVGATSGLSPNYTSNNARRFAAIGQGFVVNSVDNGGALGGGVITLNNSMRLYLAEDSTPAGNGAVFGRQSSEEHIIAMSHNGLDYMDIINNPTVIPEIRIHTKVNDLYFKENVIAFRNNTDLSYNKFCDGKNISDLPDDVYFLADSNKLVIKSLAYDENARIPLVFKASNQASSFSLTVNQLTHLEDNTINIYVYDSQEGTYTNIKNGNFDIALNEGVHDNRFEITFKNEDTLSHDVASILDFSILHDNNNSQLVIKNPNGLDINSVSLFDASGKEVFNTVDVDNKDTYRFSTSNLSDGVYVTVIGFDSNDPLSKKIIVKNN